MKQHTQMTMIAKYLLPVLLLCLFLACQEEESPEVAISEPQPTQVEQLENARIEKIISKDRITVTVVGRVLDEAGHPVGQARVSLGSQTVQTNDLGFYSVAGNVPNQFAQVTAAKASFFKASRTFTAKSNSQQVVDLYLLEKGAAGTIPSTGGKVAVDGTTFTFPDKAVTYDDGTTFTGDIQVYARYLDPQDENLTNIMPGALLGLSNEETLTALETYGMLMVELEDGQGRALQLADEKYVQLEMPARESDPSMMPLWHYNERYGVWVEYGSATKNGKVYTGEVNQFSTWNLDLPVSSASWDITLFNETENVPLAYTSFQILIDSTVFGSYYTDGSGEASIIGVPMNRDIRIKVFANCETLVSDAYRITGTSTQRVPFNLIKTSTIRGNLMDCQRTPIVQESFILSDSVSGQYYRTATDSVGGFSVAICSDSLRLIPYDYSGNRGQAVLLHKDRAQDSVFLCDGTSVKGDDEPVFFEDANLERGIRDHINKPSGVLTYGDVKDIDSLKLTNLGITSMVGLNNLTNLRILNLAVNKITEITGLEGLVNLQELDLGSNKITEISGLEGLVNLQALDLAANKITEISGLEGLVNLESLGLQLNEIAEISGLESLVNLEILYLWSNEIAEISGLEGLVNLQALDLGGNEITEISGLESLVNLEELFLPGNQITEISGLESLVNLQTLSLAGNEITKISRLESLFNLQELYLAANKITEISGLDGLVNLQILNLGINKITEISGLERLVNLELLDLSTNEIAEISGLENLNKLINLKLSWNQLLKIYGLESLVNLQTLDLEFNKITEISGLEGLVNLQKLVLRYNKISQIKGLDKLTNLQELDLRDNPVTAAQIVAYCATHPTLKWCD